ncbi:uncharacterized protein BDV17DRAFT_273616 [Aspergillus undulatus]|uniref:uncharacterized protein n=1 Tax=Aspergillus undulatus TaxID=1810928 RepID=UPI003CCCEFBD
MVLDDVKCSGFPALSAAQSIQLPATPIKIAMATMPCCIRLLSTLLLLSLCSAQTLSSISAPTGCATNRTYSVVSGDTCSKIARIHGVPRGSLVFINDVRPDCADLRVGQVLCLTQPCELYPVHIGASCLEIAEDNGISVDELFNWNCYLNASCTNLLAGDEVCIAEPEAPPAPTPTLTTITATASRVNDGYATAIVEPPGPVPRGTTPNCGEYYQVKRGDYCDSIADRFSIGLELFEAINPAINDECTNLVPGLYYCVSPTRDWNATVTTTLTSTYATAPAPTTSGTTDECYEWYIARTGDTCDRISSLYGITLREIRLWNPSLNEECTNMRTGRAYCVHGEPATDADPARVLAEATAASSIADGDDWMEWAS